MKILLISNMYPSRDDIFYGIFVKNFKEELEKNNISVNKIVIRGKGNTKLEKIKKYLLFFIKIFYKLYKNDYDVIYVHFIGLNLLPLFFKFNSKPVILNAHGSDVLVNSKISLFIQKLVIPIIRKANMIVVPSNYFQNIVSKKFNIPKNKIFVSPSGGIDTRLFKPFTYKKNDIFTIGYVSRIDKGKGWDTLLEAIFKLKQKNLTFKVMIIGSGEENSLMIQKIKDYDLIDLVEYLGAKPHAELVYYFNQIDIFSFPTKLTESLGLVGLEAMACGVPVVGSNIGGLPTYIIDGYNGKLFEAGNSEELAIKLEYFTKLNKEDMRSYKLNALSTAKKYDAKKTNEELTYKLFETSKKVYNEINT